MKRSIFLAMPFDSRSAPFVEKPSQCRPQQEDIRSKESRMKLTNEKDVACKRISIYKGVSDRPLGWKPRRHQIKPQAGTARDANIRKFDGAEQTSSEWDALRKDPELWFPEGDCLIYLYGQGQSKRGPAFQVPYVALLNAQCYPLLKFCKEHDSEPSGLQPYNGYERDSVKQPMSLRKYELYIPAPPDIGREQAMLFHIATRNFFAWVFRRSLVGPQLTGALIDLLDKMDEYRSRSVDNVSAIMDFMEEEGYADMRDHPDHALAIMGLAEHFHFRDLYIDAYVHCVGMGGKIYESSEFRFTSQVSRSLISRGQSELEKRLDRTGHSLGNFLEDELGFTCEGLPLDAQEHMDRFRCFLHEYYVSKLGYYPPHFPSRTSSAFPKDVYVTMYHDFQMLYEFIVDNRLTHSDQTRASINDYARISEILEKFDRHYDYESLVYPFPLLPPPITEAPDQSIAKRFYAFSNSDKLKRDARLGTLTALLKATNRSEADVFESSIVRAYRNFEKQCVLNATLEKRSRLSASDERKVRWLVIYAMLQTLHSVMVIPTEVHDTDRVPYHLCASIAGCPSWEKGELYEPQVPIDYLRPKERLTPTISATCSTITSANEDIRPIKSRSSTDCSGSQALNRESHIGSPPTSTPTTKGSTVRRALSALGNMPEMVHPRPQRIPFHEILIEGYGNGLNAVDGFTISSVSTCLPSHRRQVSMISDVSEKSSSQRSQTSCASSTPPSSINETKSPVTSSEHGSRTSSVYSCEADVGAALSLAPAPLSIPVRTSSLHAIEGEPNNVHVESGKGPARGNDPEL